MASGVPGVLACVLVLGVLVTGLSLFGIADAVAQEDDRDPAVQGFDEVVIDVAIAEDGSATVVVDYRYQLDDEESVEAWEEQRADVEEREEAYLEAEEARWRDRAMDAANETEREMYLSGFVVETDESSTPPAHGHVEFTFRWEAFATVELNRITAGDALDGYVLDEDTKLRFSWPEAFVATEIEPAPDDRRESVAAWNGAETEFVTGEPRVELIDEGADEDEAVEGEEEGGPSSMIALGGLALLAALGAAGWLVGRRGVSLPGADDPAESAGADSDGPPPELLSNEERVLRLLEDRGGRIKQQEVVSELGWTEAKTSQVVGGLREAGEIEVFRIGRENVLSLPEDEEADGS